MKRIFILLVVVFLAFCGVFKVFTAEDHVKDGCVVKVTNASDSRLEAVQLVGLDEVGIFGPLSEGESKQVRLNSAQARKSVFLAFGSTEKIDSYTGWNLTDVDDVSGTLITLEIGSDKSVTMWSERL